MAISENKRVITGVFVLVIVNIVWVLSSELTNYIFTNEKYNKPFLTTYLKSSMFSFLLFGFLCRAHWRMLACPQRYYSPICYHIQNNENENINEQNDDILGESIYVPINHESSDEENTRHPDDEYVMVDHGEVEDNQENHDDCKRSVKFCKYKEVRHLSETYAEDSLVARMSYNASKKLQRKMLIEKIIEQGYLPASHVMKLAAQFCFVWFIASYSYQKSLSTTLPAVVNVISSTSSLFTLILASFFPSSEKDRFSLTKLCVVFLSISGVALISFAEYVENATFHYEGIIWGLVGAVGYAIYLVNLRRIVKNEDQMSLPMFLGFVGLWTVVTLWPGFFLFNWTVYEPFEVPNWIQLGSIVLNGLLGTVGAELLWLWGCFLTSSLTATLAMCLTIPMSMVTDYFIKQKVYHWIFYLGSIPIIVSFIAVAYLTNVSGPSPDPVGTLLRRVFCGPCDRPNYERLASIDPDSNEEPHFPSDIGDSRNDRTRQSTFSFWALFSAITRPKVTDDFAASTTEDKAKLLINETRDGQDENNE